MNDLNLNSNSLAPIIAICAVIGTVVGMVVRGWSSFKAVLNNFISLGITTVHLDDEMTSQAVLAHLVKTRKRSKFLARTFGGKHENFRNGKYGHVPFEFFGGKRIIFWRGWLPLIYSVVTEKQSEAKGSGVIYWGGKPKEDIRAMLIFIRGTVNIEAIVREASEVRNNMYWAVDKRRRFFIKKIPDAKMSGFGRHSVGNNISWFHEGIYRLLSHTPEELGRQTEGDKKATDNLYFPDHIKGLIQELQIWRNRREWYKERGIPWKRGWLLYGPPGTGKTAIARAIAEDLDMPLFIFSLGELLNEDLERSWAEMQTHAPCIALFEDFDNVFNGRENVYGKPKLSDLLKGVPAAAAPADAPVALTGRLSFDTLLNCIDGADKTDGIFTVITTNHIECLDPALGQPRKNDDGSMEFISTRPGRIDKAIELGYMENVDKLKLAKRILFDNDEGYESIKKSVESENKQETPAQFQERCAQLALKLLWEKGHEAALEDKVPEVVNHVEQEPLSKRRLFQRIFQKPKRISISVIGSNKS